MALVRGVEQIPWLYDATCAVLELRGLGRWRDWLVRGARGKTLEVGCGTGRNLSRYSAEVRLVAVEPDPEMLRRARARRSRALLVRASAEALPFRDGAFDTVVASLVFCSVPDAARGLGQVHRVLAADGRLRMMEHVRSRSRFWARVQDLLHPLWRWASGGCHLNRRTEELVAAAGFAIDPEERREAGTMRRFAARRAD